MFSNSPVRTQFDLWSVITFKWYCEASRIRDTQGGLLNDFLHYSTTVFILYTFSLSSLLFDCFKKPFRAKSVPKLGTLNCFYLKGHHYLIIVGLRPQYAMKRHCTYLLTEIYYLKSIMYGIWYVGLSNVFMNYDW